MREKNSPRVSVGSGRRRELLAMMYSGRRILVLDEEGCSVAESCRGMEESAPRELAVLRGYLEVQRWLGHGELTSSDEVR